MDAADAHRAHIDRWFHACPPERHRRIAEFVVSDASFHARYEGLARGAARYFHDAVVANAARS
jgi:hypothetical protein